MMKKRILCAISLTMFLMSCSTISDKHLVEITPEKKVDNLLNKENRDILNNEKLSSMVFDRSNRKVNKNLKGVWVASIFSLDFSQTRPYDMDKQKAEIDNIVRNVKSMGLNAIFLQVKPSDTVIYPSKYHTWDKSLTGYEGTNPGYDPLEYFINSAHKNGVELHAWINPYRVSLTNDTSKLSNKHVAKRHPEWCFEYNGKIYLNPGKPEVVEYLYKSIEEIVKNYNVDGIHLDDYFYPYPNEGKKIPNFDEEEYRKYGSKYATIGDYRRANVDELIKNLSVSVHKIKPNLIFGVSPFGIWRNVTQDENGSFTDGLSTYDDLYANVVKWMENGWIDYVAPQIYWQVGHKKADYKTLVNWWGEVARRTNTPLYIGEGVYKPEINKKEELILHRNIRNENKNVNGYILFRYKLINLEMMR